MSSQGTGEHHGTQAAICNESTITDEQPRIGRAPVEMSSHRSEEHQVVRAAKQPPMRRVPAHESSHRERDHFNASQSSHPPESAIPPEQPRRPRAPFLQSSHADGEHQMSEAAKQPRHRRVPGPRSNPPAFKPSSHKLGEYHAPETAIHRESAKIGEQPRKGRVPSS